MTKPLRYSFDGADVAERMRSLGYSVSSLGPERIEFSVAPSGPQDRLVNDITLALCERQARDRRRRALPSSQPVSMGFSVPATDNEPDFVMKSRAMGLSSWQAYSRLHARPWRQTPPEPLTFAGVALPARGVRRRWAV